VVQVVRDVVVQHPNPGGADLSPERGKREEKSRAEKI